MSEGSTTAARTERATAAPQLTMTVAICTRNRAEHTRLAVRSVQAQTDAAERLEILVVDNGSTDHTGGVVNGLAATDARIRYVVEPTPGLSRARNLALQLARGDVVAFLDDDAVAAPGWASAHLDAFLDADVVATGGRIDLAWPTARPAWLPVRREGMYTGLDLGEEVRDFPPSHVPFGANMAFRRSVFDEVAPFELALGRQGRGLLSGEERELCERLQRTGGRMVYLPHAAVDHHVLPDRLGKDWFLKRCYDHGRSAVVLDLHRFAPRSRAYWLQRAGYRSVVAARHAVVAGLRTVRRSPAAARMSAAADAAESAGTAIESLRALRRPVP